MVDLSDRQAIARAAKAKALLDDAELKAAFDAVRQTLLQRIEQAPIRDREGVHELKLQLHLLSSVWANLVSVVNTGKVVEDRLNWLARAKRKLNAGKR